LREKTGEIPVGFFFRPGMVKTLKNFCLLMAQSRCDCVNTFGIAAAPLRCLLHKTKVTDFCCNSCDQAICPKCFLLDHPAPGAGPRCNGFSETQNSRKVDGQDILCLQSTIEDVEQMAFHLEKVMYLREEKIQQMIADQVQDLREREWIMLDLSAWLFEAEH